MSFLYSSKDLGIHSEMFSDGVMALANAGVVNNSKKTINTGKFTAAFLMGTKKFYDWVDRREDVELLEIEYVNDPFVIGQHENMISINSALQVDLMGQVNAEAIGPWQYSGTGGQVDFVRGASRSRGGKSIIAMPSTAAGGKLSRICAELDRGSPVTTSRNDVHFVVTEYGIADLRGRSLRERAPGLDQNRPPRFQGQPSPGRKGAWQDLERCDYTCVKEDYYMAISIPEKMKKIMHEFSLAGYAAYVVGGAVRDMVLGREPKDYDFATDAKPEEIVALAEIIGWKVVDNLGQNFGVVLIVAEGETVEIATYRGERYGADSHRPEKVWHADSLEEDLSRRDFTINAMALDLGGKLYDPFGGRDDLDSGGYPHGRPAAE